MRRVGYRGTFLILLGFFDVFYGWYLAAGAAIQHPFLIGEQAWGWIWIGVGVVLFCGAPLPPDRDRWCYTVAACLKIFWALEFFRLQLIGVPYDWTRGSYFLALTGIVMLAAAWPEPFPGKKDE